MHRRENFSFVGKFSIYFVNIHNCTTTYKMRVFVLFSSLLCIITRMYFCVSWHTIQHHKLLNDLMNNPLAMNLECHLSNALVLEFPFDRFQALISIQMSCTSRSAVLVVIIYIVFFFFCEFIYLFAALLRLKLVYILYRRPNLDGSDLLKDLCSAIHSCSPCGNYVSQ